MGRHYKKPPVSPRVRREWFRRHDEEGESLNQIAISDGYDIRTVKKVIAEARDEQESKEARLMFLRDAMAEHRDDLLDFVERLESHLTGVNSIPEVIMEDPMWKALKEHIPRSSIWRYLDRWDKLVESVNQLDAEVKSFAREQLKAKSSVGFIGESQQTGLNPTAGEAFAFNLIASANETSFLLGEKDITWMPAGDGLQQGKVGAYGIGIIPNADVPSVHNVVVELLGQATQWDQKNELQQLLVELNQVGRILADELTTIKLRRVISGKCNYCPL